MDEEHAERQDAGLDGRDDGARIEHGEEPQEEARHGGARGEEWKARGETAASTQQRLVAGRPATGVTALAGLLRCGPLVGELVVAQIALWLGIASPGGEKAPYMPTSAFMPIPKKGREGHEGHSEGNGREWEGVLLSEVKIERLRWLWPGRIPLGKVVILDGDPGLGTSLISLDLAARVSTRRGMPLALEGEAGKLEGEAHGVVLLSAEDGLADTIAPRLLAAGADCARTMALRTVRAVDPATGMLSTRGWLLPRDIPKLASAIEQMQARLVVIDPLMAYLDPSQNSFRDQHARLALDPLAELARETGRRSLSCGI